VGGWGGGGGGGGGGAVCVTRRVDNLGSLTTICHNIEK